MPQRTTRKMLQAAPIFAAIAWRSRRQETLEIVHLCRAARVQQQSLQHPHHDQRAEPLVSRVFRSGERFDTPHRSQRCPIRGQHVRQYLRIQVSVGDHRDEDAGEREDHRLDDVGGDDAVESAEEDVERRDADDEDGAYVGGEGKVDGGEFADALEGVADETRERHHGGHGIGRARDAPRRAVAEARDHPFRARHHVRARTHLPM